MLLSRCSIAQFAPQCVARPAAAAAGIWPTALGCQKGIEQTCRVKKWQQQQQALPRRSAARQAASQKNSPATRRSLSECASSEDGGVEDDNRVVLWASKVAALIGMHEHVPRHKALEEVWEKRNGHHLDQVKGLIKSRQGIKVTSAEEEVRNAIKQTGAEEIIQEVLATTILDKSFHGANAAKEEAHNRLDKTGRDIAAEMLRMNIDAVKCMNPSEKEKATRLGEGMLKKGTNIEVIERELTRHLSMANVPRSQAKEVVASSISSTKSSIRLVEREVVEKINTEHGKNSEMCGIDQFTKETGLAVSRGGENRLKTTNAWHTSSPQVMTVLGGRPDGVAMVSNPGGGNKLVEVKSRMKTLFDKIPLYEQIQMHVLLFALGLDECYHVQTLRGRDKTEIKITEFKKDPKLWEETIVPRAVQFSCGYLDLLNDLDKAEEYIKADAERKEHIIDDLFGQYPLNQVREGPRGVC